MTKDKRTLKDLNLMDKFLFDEAMEDKDNMKTLLDIVLGQDTHLKYPPQTEKEFRNSKENRQIRLDIYAIDEDYVVYDTEPQKQNTKNLPKRSRLYQGLIDSNLLPPGSIDFNALNTVIIIMIMPFDLFGYELYQYTFRMKCEEISELELEDGATRIFLNSHGKHPEFVNPELIELLEYMEKSTDTVAKSVKVNGFIRYMNVSPSLNPAKKWRLNTCKNGKKKRLNDKKHMQKANALAKNVDALRVKQESIN